MSTFLEITASKIAFVVCGGPRHHGDSWRQIGRMAGLEIKTPCWSARTLCPILGLLPSALASAAAVVWRGPEASDT